MAPNHSKTTIASMAVVAGAMATLLHEGLGHGVVAWLRGDIPTEITSNHLSALRADHWVEAAGTIVNLVTGFAALGAAKAAGGRANLRYFLWILAALNLLPGAGYFLFSGMFGFGDWYQVIHNLPNQTVLRSAMALFGAAAYVFVVRLLAIAAAPFAPGGRGWGTVGVLPYVVAGLFSCAAGAFDPLASRLFLLSTVAAAFGGSSGLLWADHMMPRNRAATAALTVQRQPAWWIAAILIGVPYIWFIGHGIAIPH